MMCVFPLNSRQLLLQWIWSIITTCFKCFLFIPHQVQYQSDQFLDKNKDYVVPEHQDLLSASKCPFVVGLFPPVAEESTKSSSKSSKFSSIGSRFKVVTNLYTYEFW